MKTAFTIQNKFSFLNYMFWIVLNVCFVLGRDQCLFEWLSRCLFKAMSNERTRQELSIDVNFDRFISKINRMTYALLIYMDFSPLGTIALV